MDEHTEIHALLKEIQANQQSLHDDMASVVDRLTKLEATITEQFQNTPEPHAIDAQQLYLAARALVVESGKCSTSFLQRILRVGYSKAAMLVDMLEERGVVGAQNGSEPRAVLIDMEQLEELEENEEDEQNNGPVLTGDHDDLYEEAKAAVIEAGKSSTSYIQRKLRVGYSRAVFLQNLLEKNGVIGPRDGAKPREILIN
jgi:DNA segregation ATPase FtsK/SpoIIIE-like protein